jgi:ATP-binding cassette, subfamily B, bacterial
MKKTSEKQLIKQILRMYWEHAWKYKGLVIALFTVVPATVFIFTFLPPLIFARILQRLSDGDFIRGDLWGSFGPDLLLYAGVCLLGGVVMWRLAVFLIWRLEMNVVRDIQQRIFNQLMHLSSSFHANRFSGSLVSQSNKFTGGYVRIADAVIFDIITMLLAFIFAFVILWPRAPIVVIIMFVFSIIFITTSILITGRVRRLSAIEAGKSNQQTGFLADAITNVMAVKSFAGGPYERQRFARATNETRSATNNMMWASIKRDTLFASMTTTLGIATLGTSVASVVLHNADIATIFLVITYTANIGERLWEFSQRTLRNLNRAFGDAQDMAETLALQPEVKDIKRAEKPRIKRGAIEIKGMTFTHPENDKALFRGLSISIKSGEKIGLVGHSGSGKTSLTKLLLRFNDIDDGTILIDGQDITRITQDNLRKHIAYVPQEPLLFHRTIRENIAYGKPDASEDEVRAAARKANASEFIEKLKDGYDTLVGERGVKLSGGQRQRVAIARAILKDAPILVLDEATSALDSESEKLIQSALWELMKGRTAIVIAHRLSTIQKMDRILVMEDGEIVEQGSHAELVKTRGIYAQLWAHQTGGFLNE